MFFLSIYRKKWIKQRTKQIAEWEATHGQVQNFEFNTCGIIGSTGSGKTLTMTWIGNNFAQQGVPIFSNYHVRLPNSTYIQDPYELLMCDGILLVDEISKYANSRLSGDSKTLFFTELTSQARKVAGSVYYTDQRFMNVDTRIRNNTDYILFPDYTKSLHWCIVYAFEGLNYTDPLDVFEFDCLPIYTLFDTKEKIKSVYQQDHAKEYADASGKTIDDTIAEAVQLAKCQPMEEIGLIRKAIEPVPIRRAIKYA